MATVKKRLRCSECGNVWENKDTRTRTHCPLCGKSKEARDRKEYSRKYAKAHPERMGLLKNWCKTHNRREKKDWNSLVKKSVLTIISGLEIPICNSCGCDDIRLLEVNHINGGGKRELESGKNACEFYWKIYRLERDISDLEVLCRVCNAKHYLELKYGKIPMEIIWDGKRSI